SIVYHYSLRPFSSTDPATYEIYTLSLHDALPILGDFASGGSFGVGTVNGVLIDGYGEVGANGARSSFFRVGGTHQLTVLGDGVLTFQHLHDDRTGGHEGDQILEETALAVLGVETGGFALGQLNHLGSDDAQAGLLETGG